MTARTKRSFDLFGPVRSVARRVGFLTFPGSRRYWENRYAAGRDSGRGSYGDLAHFKAQYLNAFVRRHGIESVIELGCGDGNQLTLAEYPRYVGLDVSKTAVVRCIDRFGNDRTKSFLWYDPEAFCDPLGLIAADCSLSLDVIFHLVEDSVFESYMAMLFRVARRWVVIYSSNIDRWPEAHVRHRTFTRWIGDHQPDYALVEHLENRHPERSPSEFFVFARNPEV